MTGLKDLVVKFRRHYGWCHRARWVLTHPAVTLWLPMKLPCNTWPKIFTCIFMDFTEVNTTPETVSTLSLPDCPMSLPQDLLPLHKWGPISSDFRAAALRPSVSPAFHVRGWCSQKSLTLAVSICPQGPFEFMGVMVISAFPWGGAAVVGFLHAISLATKGRSPCLLLLHDAAIWIWNISMVVSQNALRGGSV